MVKFNSPNISTQNKIKSTIENKKNFSALSQLKIIIIIIKARILFKMQPWRDY